MTLAEVKKDLDGVYCRLRPSLIPGAGVGVFSIRPIAKGTNPFRGCQDTKVLELPADQLRTCDENVSQYVKDMAIYDAAKDVYFYPTIGLNQLDLFWYVNHSSQPNLVADDNGDFWAVRDIARGEELTADYTLYGKGNAPWLE